MEWTVNLAHIQFTRLIAVWICGACNRINVWIKIRRVKTRSHVLIERLQGRSPTGIRYACVRVAVDSLWLVALHCKNENFWRSSLVYGRSNDNSWSFFSCFVATHLNVKYSFYRSITKQILQNVFSLKKNKQVKKCEFARTFETKSPFEMFSWVS